MTDTNPPADRTAEIRARLDAAGHCTWGATYDDYHEDKGSHWELRLRDGHEATLAGGYDEWHPVLDLVCNAPDDIAHLLSELDKAHRRNELLTIAKNHATEQRDKHARRVIQWREAAERAAAERDAARDVVRDFNNRLERKEAHLEELERQLAAVDAVHKPKRLYTGPDTDDRSFETPEDAAEYDDVPLDAVTFFDVCEHCGDIEIDDDPDRSYRESLWPCKTAKARGIEAGR